MCLSQALPASNARYPTPKKKKHRLSPIPTVVNARQPLLGRLPSNTREDGIHITLVHPAIYGIASLKPTPPLLSALLSSIIPPIPGIPTPLLSLAPRRPAPAIPLIRLPRHLLSTAGRRPTVSTPEIKPARAAAAALGRGHHRLGGHLVRRLSLGRRLLGHRRHLVRVLPLLLRHHRGGRVRPRTAVLCCPGRRGAT